MTLASVTQGLSGQRVATFLLSDDTQTNLPLLVVGASLALAIAVIHLQDKGGLLGDQSPVWLKYGSGYDWKCQRSGDCSKQEPCRRLDRPPGDRSCLRRVLPRDGSVLDGCGRPHVARCYRPSCDHAPQRRAWWRQLLCHHGERAAERA